MVLGAILAFAIDDRLPAIHLHVVGLILMVAGAAVIAQRRHGDRHERVVRRVEEPLDPGEPPRVVEEVIREQDRH
jgi:hypothetical protein